VGAYVSHQKNGHQLALAGVNDRVRSLFSMTQVDRFFKNFGTVAEAETALQASARSTAGQALNRTV
jgi:anti-anti-sigma regulatory factor